MGFSHLGLLRCTLLIWDNVAVTLAIWKSGLDWARLGWFSSAGEEFF